MRAEPAAHHVVGAGTVRIAVDRPSGDRPVWLAGHGVGSSADYLHETFGGPVRAAGYELCTWQLRGHGASGVVDDPARHGLAHHVADLVAVAATVAPTVISGVSLAGHAAVAATARGLVQPRAVVACLPAWIGRSIPVEGVHAAIADEIRAQGVDAIRQRFPDDPALRPWLRRVLVRDWARHDPASLRASLVALDGALAPTSVELASMPVPLGVVGWADDPGHPLEIARLWATTAPRGHLETIDITDPDHDLEAMGRAAVRALSHLGIPSP